MKKGDNFFKIKDEEVSFVRSDKLHFYFDDGKYFFKADDRCASILESELLADKIGQKLGVDVLHVKPAQYTSKSNKKYVGLMSENFFLNNLRVQFDNDCMLLISRHNYYDVCTAVQKFVNQTQIMQPELNLKLEPKFFSKLQDMMFFDFLTFQGDRYSRNFDFYMKQTKDGWELCFAPIYDNSWIFGFQDFIFNNIDPSKAEVEKYIQNNQEFVFGYVVFSSYEGMKTDMHIRTIYNERYKILAKRAYLLDIDKCIDEIESENPGFVFDPKLKLIANHFWDYTKKILEKDFNIKRILKDLEDFEK